MEARDQGSGIRCNEHPDAPHGFMRDASHSAGRYVCECEFWEPQGVKIHAGPYGEAWIAKEEPVAHVYRIEANGRPCVAWDDANGIKVGAKLYAAPPKRDLTCVCGAVWDGEQMVHAPRKREWVGLTDEEIDTAWRSVDYTVPYNQFRIDVARAIEAKLQEKNA